MDRINVISECLFLSFFYTLSFSLFSLGHYRPSPVLFSFIPQNEITGSKVLFPEHLPLSRIQAGIKSGSFLQGTFRASRDNYLEATVFVQGDGEDSTEVRVDVSVKIQGSQFVMQCLRLKFALLQTN